MSNDNEGYTHQRGVDMALHPSIMHINYSSDISPETLMAINSMVEKVSRMSVAEINNIKTSTNKQI